MRLKSVILAAIGAFVLSGCVCQSRDSESDYVLVVQNEKSPVSMRVASYYVQKRHINKRNIVTISVQDSSKDTAGEKITLDDFAQKIYKPVRDHLTANKTENKIKYIVLTKGIPIKLDKDPVDGKVFPQSVDSLLAGMDLKEPVMLQIRPSNAKLGFPTINRYWNSKEPFSHEKYGGYLVTRLDGYTEADAKALVDRALGDPPAKPVALLDCQNVRGDEDLKDIPVSFIAPDGTPRFRGMTYQKYDYDILKAAKILEERGDIEVRLSTDQTFTGCEKSLTFYASWGSNDKGFSQEVYRSLRFTPRSIAETAVSTSGRTMLPREGGQSLMCDLVAQGVAGCKCYVSEPYLYAIASPSIAFELYAEGRNLAESFYAASRVITWKDIVLGDPLCKLR
ncbi:MAG: TIGR03790 family protein [Abditibacteriota bacterium]|nr:TIGR03790 family protein [Abditibacteriota bacterium]